MVVAVVYALRLLCVCLVGLRCLVWCVPLFAWLFACVAVCVVVGVLVWLPVCGVVLCVGLLVVNCWWLLIVDGLWPACIVCVFVWGVGVAHCTSLSVVAHAVVRCRVWCKHMSSACPSYVSWVCHVSCPQLLSDSLTHRIGYKVCGPF